MPRLFKIWMAFCIALIPIAVMVQLSVWDECRSSGHSALYCSTLISRR